MDELRTNTKRLSPEEQYLIRKNIVRLLKKDMKPEAVAETLDVSRSHVYSTKKTYDEKGIAGLKPKKRGRKKGDERKLLPEQEKEIQKIIIDKYPEQLKLPGCMWTRANIKNLINTNLQSKAPYKLALFSSYCAGSYLRIFGYAAHFACLV